MMLYRNKEKPWKHICTMRNNYRKHYFWYFMSTPNNTFQLPPRFHAHINLFLISFWRDNSNLRFGIGWGKRQYSLNFHK